MTGKAGLVMLAAASLHLAVPVVVSHAAAPGPVALSRLHLDQPSATLSFGAGQVTFGSGCAGGGPSSLSAQIALSAASDGTAIISYAGFVGPVLEVSPGQLQFTATAHGSSTVTNVQMLTGIGTTFTGQGSAIVSSQCTVTAPVTLTLAGSGLTLLAPSPSPSAAPAAPSTAPQTRSPSPSEPPTSLQETCAQTVNASASALLSADHASVTTAVPGDGTLTGTLAFDGGGGTGTGINYPLVDPPHAWLVSSDSAAVTCSDACIFAYDGGGGSGSGIDYQPPSPPRVELVDTTGQSCPFDGGGGSGSGIDFPIGHGDGATDLAAEVLAAANPTALPEGTVLASAQASYAAAGTQTLVLPLSVAGRSLFQQVAAADAEYLAAHPGAATPPYARLLLTLKFTPRVSGSVASASGLPVLPVVVGAAVLAILAATVAVLRRRRVPSSAAGAARR